MPGLIGIVRREPDPALQSRFDRGMQRLRRGATLLHESAGDPAAQWMMGRAHLGALQPAAQGRTGYDPVVWVHGDVTNAAELSKEEGFAQPLPTAELLGRLYRRHGLAFPSRIQGTFAVALFDIGKRQLILATDLVGSYPVYWRHDAEGCTYASTVSAVLAMSGATSLDLRAVADYLTIGFVLGDKTLARDVSLLGPGETFVFDADSGQARVTQHGDLTNLFQAGHGTRDEYVEALPGTFSQAVKRCLGDSHAFGLSLSGGLDSRAILSAINGQAPDISTYTLGIRGCADQVIGERLAAISGTRHRFFELGSQYLKDFLPNLAEMVSLTDGLYLSHGLTEMLVLQFIGETRSTVLLRGHGGELAKMTLAWPLHTDATVYRLGDLNALGDYIAGRANYLTPTLSLEQLLTPPAASLAGRGSRDSLRQVLANVPLTPPQACGYLYLREQHRRYTVPSLDLFRGRIEVRLPFLDPEFLRVLLSGPPAWRDDTSIHRAIVSSGHRALLKVRNSNTGARADAGPMVERVMERVNTLMKRAQVQGFRHYHNFDGWMRRMLLDSVKQELLGAPARTHAWVRPDVVKRLVDETASGAANHGYLLQALLILELWQRQNDVESVG